MLDRTMKQALLRANDNFKVILLTGMRQVGKTTFLKECAGDRNYVTLDNPKDLLLAKTEPQLFFETYKPPVLIDEIQYAPELFPYIKMLVDNSEGRGLVWLTGSQPYELMRGINESLAGRIGVFQMLGLSLYELEGKAELSKPFLPTTNLESKLAIKNSPDTFKIIWNGSFPDIATGTNKDWQNFYASYTKSYLERDIRGQINVNTTDFLRFIKVVASRTATELNLTDIAKDSDISPNTAKNWLAILERCGLVYLLKPYANNLSIRLIKAPKIYFLDTGLCSYLTEWNTPETLMSGAFAGQIFETFVFGEIMKSYWHNGEEPNIYYYRDTEKNEIDLLISQNDRLYPIEIKKTSNPNKHMLNLKVLAKFKKEIGTGVIICLTDQARPLSKEVWAMNVWEM